MLRHSAYISVPGTLDDVKAFVRFLRGMPDVESTFREGTSLGPTVGFVVMIQFTPRVGTHEDAYARAKVYLTLFQSLRNHTHDAFRAAREEAERNAGE